MPFNIFDRRLLENNLINKLNSQKVEIHVRSVFLQGLLLMNSNQIHKKFNKWKNNLLEWDTWTYNNKINKLNACMNFVISFKKISKILIGVNSEKELSDLNKIKLQKITVPEFKITNKNKLINPMQWNSLDK